MDPERESVARDMARWHFTVEPLLTKVLWVRTEDGPLRLIDVSVERPGIERGVEVFGFDATAEVPFPSEIIDLTERELGLLIARVMTLPPGWSLENATVYTPDDLAVQAHRDAG